MHCVYTAPCSVYKVQCKIMIIHSLFQGLFKTIYFFFVHTEFFELNFIKE